MIDRQIENNNDKDWRLIPSPNHGDIIRLLIDALNNSIVKPIVCQKNNFSKKPSRLSVPLVCVAKTLKVERSATSLLNSIFLNVSMAIYVSHQRG